MARSHQGKQSLQNDEQRRDSILQQAHVYQQLLFIPEDTSANDRDTETLWDISNSHQLQYLAKQHPTQLLQSLNKLRRKRDVAFSRIKKWDTMVDKVDRTNTDAIEAQQQKKKAQENVCDLQSKNVDFEIQNSRLEYRILQLKIISSFKQEQTPSLTLNTSRNCTSKISDLPLYCKIESDIAIEDWTKQIRDEITVNKDHCENNAAQTIYVISRTRGTAA